MLKRVLALGVASLLIGTTAMAAEPASKETAPVVAAPVAAPVAVPATGPLQITVKPQKELYLTYETATVTVTATNTTQETLSYWLATPCAAPFRVEAVGAGGSTTPLASTNPAYQAHICAMHTVQVSIAPGGSITDQYTWDTYSQGIKPGDYTLVANFAGAPATDTTAASTSGKASVKVAGMTDLEGHWAWGAIVEGIHNGMITGYPDFTFKPDKAITRAEFLALLVKARHLSPNYRHPSFDDMDNNWLATQGSLEAAVEAGYVKGGWGLLFHPDDLMTREEAAVMLVRAMYMDNLVQEGPASPFSFDDRAEIETQDAGYVAVACHQAIFVGYPDNTFRPNQGVTRAEAVVLIGRMLGATSVDPDPTARVLVDGEQVGIPVIARRDISGATQPLAPLDAVAAAAGAQIAKSDDDWMTITRGDVTVKFKAGVPYLFTNNESASLDGAPPALTDGQYWVPEAVLTALGLTGHWDGKTWSLSTH